MPEAALFHPRSWSRAEARPELAPKKPRTHKTHIECFKIMDCSFGDRIAAKLDLSVASEI
jgi:hypothetical protein